MKPIEKRFSKLTNTYDKKYLTYVENKGLTGGTFVVQEKAHGANFSLHTDGNTVWAASRNNILEPGDSFYSYQKVLEKYTQSMLELFELMSLEDMTLLTVFGELIGGSSFKGVEDLKEYSTIQKGVFYTNKHEFYTYDVMVNNSVYLSVDKAALLLNSYFFTAPALFEGTLEECLKYPNKFNSKIPDCLGFKLDGNEPNICEGVVIKPLFPVYLQDSSRLVFKNKNEVWSEKSKKTKAKPTVKVSEECSEVLSNLETFITLNRVTNVVSKIGEVSFKDFSTIIKNLVKDVMEDYLQEYPKELSVLEKSEKKFVSKYLGQKCSNKVREFLKSM